MRRGFGLIEFMIVITIFGIAVSVITASYLTFEHNQRLKGAAQMLKSDIRLVQSKALSGDKGSSGSCSASSTLIGWYLKIDRGVDNDSYTIAGDCKVTGVGEQSFNATTVDLPRGVWIMDNGISCGMSDDYGTFLYRPMTSGVSIHNNIAPPFLDSSDNLTNIIPCSGLTTTITLQLESDTSKTYQVVVRPSGEVNEQKP